MKTEKTRLTAQECLCFALECEGYAQIEQDHEHRARLLKMASALHDLAASLKNSRGLR